MCICLSLVVATACTGLKPLSLASIVPAVYDNEDVSREGRWPTQDWYREFASDELNSLIDAARLDNADLAVARARVTQADARARLAGASILPSLDAIGNASLLSGRSAQGGGHELDWSALLSASYEVDFWGRNRAIADSARLLAGASRAERDTVALTTLAGVADSYFQLMALRERLTLATFNSDAARKLLAVVQSRFEAGVASAVELAIQKSMYATARIAVTDLEQTATQAHTTLALLLGRPPENFEVPSLPLDAFHEPQIGAGLPSQLLARRPDILRAETNLQAGHADLQAARAAMFPTLSLTASGGVQNPALPATVLTIPGVGPSFGLGANLIQPIFDHGKLLAQRDEVQAKQLELLAAYRSAIVAALGDVENALAGIHHAGVSHALQLENVAQSERAFEGAKSRYLEGVGDFVILLEAQRTFYTARDQLVQYKLARLQVLVALCKALGGGWINQPVQAPIASTFSEKFP